MRSYPDISVAHVTVCEEDPSRRARFRGRCRAYESASGLAEMVQAIRLLLQAAVTSVRKSLSKLPSTASACQRGLLLFDKRSEREIQIALMTVGCQKAQVISYQTGACRPNGQHLPLSDFRKLSVKSDVELALLAVRHGMVMR